MLAVSVWYSVATAETSQLSILGACAALQRDGKLLVDDFIHVHAAWHPLPALDRIDWYFETLKSTSPEQKLAQESEIMKGVTEANEMVLTDSDCTDALVSVHREYCTFRLDTGELGMVGVPLGESCDPLDLVMDGHHPNDRLLMHSLGLAER